MSVVLVPLAFLMGLATYPFRAIPLLAPGFDRLPPQTTWLGAPLIVGAGLLIAWREHRLSLQRARALVGE